jgi:surface antigen
LIPKVFETRFECVFKFSKREEEVRVHEARLPVNDSESEGSGNSQCDESLSSTSSTTEEEDNNDIPLGDTWDQRIEFQPMEANPSQRFVEHCTSTARNRCQQIGLQCSPPC